MGAADKGGLGHVTGGQALRATRGEGAALGQIEQRRGGTRDGAQAVGARAFKRWNAVEKGKGIGVAGGGEEGGFVGPFNDAARKTSTAMLQQQYL